MLTLEPARRLEGCEGAPIDPPVRYRRRAAAMALAIIRTGTIQPGPSKTLTFEPGSTPIRPTSMISPEYLREQTRWIRDVLDQEVAREGPDSIHAEDILKLDELIRQLRDSDLGVRDIKYSRIHLAMLEISGRATRWPRVVIERCDAVAEVWEQKFGRLQDLGTCLYEEGGRLYGVCRPEDTSKDKLMIRWMKAKEIKAFAAHTWGDLGFKPGDWWINPLFAHRDGIIDRSENDGGIVTDAHGAYAVLMAGDEEVSSPSPNEFIYRAKYSHGSGRYRLTAATRDSRKPVRILRSHTLRSFWTPKAGVRYDGLHKVTAWSIRQDRKTKEHIYDITFTRLSTEPSMESIVLCRPWAEEVEDYKQYKRLRQLARSAQHKASELEQSKDVANVSTTIDGTFDVAEADLLGGVPPETGPVELDDAVDDEEKIRTSLTTLADSPGVSMADLLNITAQHEVSSPGTPPVAPLLTRRQPLAL
ncbi:hypothetical protein Tdes44962_MAKER04899 [Teratosphaeria destructans]|uniref:YDG domain-containing protein n=1 Tax=Teratosphaeria destructans TaxID=418781 RepID=A0A9W7SL92_9PEZI|nr:hypothetical protein Tdes44962_MAKER04899 [Teratosphaeria destructans]